MNEQALAFPEAPKMDAVAAANRMKPIVNDAGVKRVSEALAVLGALKREVGSAFDPIVDDTHKAKRASELAWKTAKAKRSEYLDPIAEAERKLRAFGADWTVKEQRRLEDEQREEQRRLEAARQEEIRKLEAARQEEIRRLQAIADEEAAKTRAELIADGVPQEMAEAAAEPAEVYVEPVREVPVQAPPVAKPPPQFAGMTVAKRWVGKVVDEKLACASIAAGDAPVSAVTFQQKVLNQMAATHRNADKVPGFVFGQQAETRSSGR